MENLLTRLFYYCIDIFHFFASIKKIKLSAPIIKKSLDLKENVPIEDFLRIYNTRTYDIINKQNDIKIFKKIDFKGIYILRNNTKSKCYVGNASSVFKKVERHFRGYENQEIYTEWKKGDQFFVNIIKFENSGYDNIDLLERDIKEAYNAYDYK